MKGVVTHPDPARWALLLDVAVTRVSADRLIVLRIELDKLDQTAHAFIRSVRQFNNLLTALPTRERLAMNLQGDRTGQGWALRDTRVRDHVAQRAPLLARLARGALPARQRYYQGDF